MFDTPRRLIEWFVRFPGIGPKQAKRFVYFLAAQNRASLRELADLILRLPNDMVQCASCFRFAARGSSEQCDICASTVRDDSLLMILSHDADLEAVERSRTYTGRYFVLGGLLSPLDKEPEAKVRLRELLARVTVLRPTLREIIIALPAHAEGDYSAIALRDHLMSPLEGTSVTISVLGRGLSTGTEIEYSDSETLEHALKNRVTR